MPVSEHDDAFHGYVKAKLEELLMGQTEQWGAINGVKRQIEGVSASVAVIEATAAKATDVAALKATARAWGSFAGVISGIGTALGVKLWKP
jgi:hypothetical protein